MKGDILNGSCLKSGLSFSSKAISICSAVNVQAIFCWEQPRPLLVGDEVVVVVVEQSSGFATVDCGVPVLFLVFSQSESTFRRSVQLQDLFASLLLVETVSSSEDFADVHAVDLQKVLLVASLQQWAVLRLWSPAGGWLSNAPICATRLGKNSLNNG